MWKFYNANFLNNHVNDCVVRAISVAENHSWKYTFNKLSDLARDEGILLDDVNFVESYLDKCYKRACHSSKTVGEFAEENNKGTYLVTMPRSYYLHN